MKRTHLASFSSRNITQEQEEQEEEEEEEDTNGDNRNIMNHYKNYEAGLIPWPPKNYTCSFCRRDFRSAQALGGHMNVHRRDRAKLRQIPSWLFEPHHHNNHIPIPNPNPNPNPRFLTSTSSSSTIPTHDHDLEASLRNQRSTTRTFSSDLLDNTTSYGGLIVEREKNKSNIVFKKSEISRGDLMNKKDGELGMGLKHPKQVLDLELRLGYL